jgi:hypothetical protein
MSRRSEMLRIGAGVLLAAMLAGCSDIYYDRRDTISFAANDAVATAMASQTIDPWPRGSKDRTVAANGVVVQSAIERYRTCQVIQPKGTLTSGSSGYASAQQTAQPGCTPQPAGAASASTSNGGVK